MSLTIRINPLDPDSIDKAVRDLEYKPSCTPEDAIIETALWAAQATNCKF